MTSPKKLWLQETQGGLSMSLLNLDHSKVEKRIIDDMSQGTEVFYDRRWEITAELNSWLGSQLDLFRNKRVLVLGAGIGAETVLLGKFADHLWINDLSPVALELCGEQLKQNGITNFSPLPGRYESLTLPEVDLVVACFLVYNTETLKAMQAYLAEQSATFILVNEALPAFHTLLKNHPHQQLFQQHNAIGVSL